MVKKIFSLQNQGSFEAESSGLGLPLTDDDLRMTFFMQGQICVSMQSFEKSLSQNVLKTNG